MRRIRLRQIVLVALATTLVGAVPATPVLSVTKAQVNEACAASKEQAAEYEAARAAFEEAYWQSEEIRQRREELESKRERVSTMVEARSTEIARKEDVFERQTVELYMQGGDLDSSVYLLSTSLSDMVVSRELLQRMSTASQESIDEMVAAKESLNRFIGELETLDGELQALEVEATLVMDARQEAADKEQAAFKKLNAECQKLQRQYQAQVAAELARKRAAQTAGYKGPGNIPGFICPFPGSSFVDSWGAPRSGGRKHKGTDLMGPWNGRIYAVTSGTVITRTGGLGGNAIWLEGGGYGYYYAHLSSFNVRNGQYVNKGDLIGFNGDTGNAKGGYPHLHFEIHPGGKSYSAVNPYPALVQVCR